MYRGHLLAVALAAIAVQNVAAALSLTEVRIPKHVVHGSTAELECLYDLDGELLYSVKWYKDGDEFFRYVPRDVPPTQVFSLPGISVDMSRSANNRVLLDTVNAATSGRYRCEVSGEAPLFQTVADHGDLVVVYLPAQEPRITGGRRHYRAGDIADLNCTAGASRPAAQLAWLVNGEPAPSGALRGPWLAVSAGGLHTAVLGLRMVVRSEDFRGGELKFKCLAKISSVYERARENSAEDWEAQQQPAQAESRVPNYAQATTADHTQNSSSASCYRPYTVVMAVIVTLFTWSFNRR